MHTHWCSTHAHTLACTNVRTHGRTDARTHTAVFTRVVVARAAAAQYHESHPVVTQLRADLLDSHQEAPPRACTQARAHAGIARAPARPHVCSHARTHVHACILNPPKKRSPTHTYSCAHVAAYSCLYAEGCTRTRNHSNTGAWDRWVDCKVSWLLRWPRPSNKPTGTSWRSCPIHIHGMHSRAAQHGTAWHSTARQGTGTHACAHHKHIQFHFACPFF